jgi:hypothetical protein
VVPEAIPTWRTYEMLIAELEDKEEEIRELREIIAALVREARESTRVHP